MSIFYTRKTSRDLNTGIIYSYADIDFCIDNMSKLPCLLFSEMNPLFERYEKYSEKMKERDDEINAIHEVGPGLYFSEAYNDAVQHMDTRYDDRAYSVDLKHIPYSDHLLEYKRKNK